MSLDISLSKNEEEVISMNWLRNPFGLERWASDNTNLNFKKDLWYVCNHWNYDKSSRVNRQMFQEVVLQYWEVVKELKDGYFYFDLPAYQQFVEPNKKYMELNFNNLGIKGERYNTDKQDDRRLAIPMWQFKHPEFHLQNCSLEYYKNWFNELVEFAELLQDKSYAFYCSN